MDTDPGLSNANLINNDSTWSSYLVKYNTSGNYLKSTQFSANYPAFAYFVLLDTDGNDNIFISGMYSGSFDADPGPGIHMLNSTASSYPYFVKLAADTCNNISVFVDSLTPPTCLQPGYVSAQAMNGTPGYQYIWNTTPVVNTPAAVIPDKGFYTVTATDATGCEAVSTVLVDGPKYASAPDLKITGVSSDVLPSDTTYVGLHVTNTGCVPSSGTLFFEIGSDVTFVNSIPPPDLILGDSLLWFLNTIQYGDPALIYQIKLLGDTTLSFGDSVCFYGSVSVPPSDADPGNNNIALCDEVQTSYDPNDKRVFPVGMCDGNNVLKNEKLTYTIRFQNLGDTSAFNIRIIDTLSASLDISTLVVAASSHPVITEVLPGNILNFRFSNINLPHAAANYQESMGYLVYEIFPDTTAPDQTIVTNKALIFFDYNLPIITNEVFNTLFDTLPALPDTTISMNGITLIAVPGYTSYQWINCNTGLNIGTATSSSFTPWLNGSYKVRINNNGCATTSGCHTVNSVGLDELMQNQLLQIHPNPVAEKFQITIPENMKGARLQVMDVLGKVIYQAPVPSSGIAVIESGNWQNGIYFIRVTSGDLTITGRVIQSSRK